MSHGDFEHVVNAMVVLAGKGANTMFTIDSEFEDSVMGQVSVEEAYFSRIAGNFMFDIGVDAILILGQYLNAIGPTRSLTADVVYIFDKCPMLVSVLR